MPIGNGLAIIRGGFDIPPVGVDDSYTTTVGESKIFSPLDNDTDPDLFPTNGDLTIKSCDTISSANNLVTLNADKKTVTYSPRAGYFGTDTFKYKAFDSLIESNETTVSVIVTCLPPVITDKKLNFNVGNDYVINIRDADFDSANVFFVGGLPDRDVNPVPQNVTIVPGSVSVAGNGFRLLGVVDNHKITLRCSADAVIGGVPTPISVTYTIINQCGLTTTATVNGFIDAATKRRFVFDFDYLVLTYTFNDGNDLDTRTRLVSPDIGQNAAGTYLGWGQQRSATRNSKNILVWGGDNTGRGQESCIFYLNELVSQFPDMTDITIDCRAMWYGSTGTLVNIAAFLAKGGTPFKTGFSYGVNSATNTQTIASFQRVMSYSSQTAEDSGQRVATLKYNIPTVTGIFDSNDTTTPSV